MVLIDPQKIVYGTGVIHDLSSLTLESGMFGVGDIVNEQGIQLERVEPKKGDKSHPLFSTVPVAAYIERLGKDYEKKPYIFTAEGLSSMSALQVRFVVQPHTKVTIIERISGQKLLVLSVYLDIQEGAEVTYSREGSTSIPMHTALYREALVHKNATITWYDTIQKEHELTHETITRLVGEGAVGNIKSCILGTDTQLFDTFHQTIHEAPHTKSSTDIRVILDGEARHIGRAKTTMLPHAIQTNAREEIHTILLSEKAKTQTIPDLDIRENDVQCSHAVTTTHLSREKLFYLSSRGINEKDSIALTLGAHLAPVLPPNSDPTVFIRNFLVHE